jgi:hypothetical protein
MAKAPTTPTRQSRRYPHLRDLSVHYEGSSEEIALRSPDISARGMFINTTREMPEGAVLTLRFRLTRSGHEVSARAEVRYCLPGVGVGVEFVEISPEDQQAIEEEIRLSEGGSNPRRY